MTPDSLESRFARLEQRAEDLSTSLKMVSPLAVNVGVLTSAIEGLQRDVTRLGNELDKFEDESVGRDGSLRERIDSAFTQLRTMLEASTKELRSLIDQNAAAISDKEVQERKDRRTTRNVLYGVAGTMIASIVAGTATVLVAIV